MNPPRSTPSGFPEIIQLSRPDVDVDVFVGASEWMPRGRVFGGQVLAQSLIAASATVDHDRPAHSMHAYFHRPGDLSEPIKFTVERTLDARSSSRRHVIARQRDDVIFTMTSSFQLEAAGFEHQHRMPSVADPEEADADREGWLESDGDVAEYMRHGRSVEMRYLDAPTHFRVHGKPVGRQAAWFRLRRPLPDDPTVHRAALAYASDHLILESIYRRHRTPSFTPGLRAASLDHAVWWHRPGRLDDWVLYVTETPSAQGGRGLATGRIYSRDGMLLASIAQEGMIRPPRP